MRNYQLTYGGGQLTSRLSAAFQAMAETLLGQGPHHLLQHLVLHSRQARLAGEVQPQCRGSHRTRRRRLTPWNYTLPPATPARSRCPSATPTITFDATRPTGRRHRSASCRPASPRTAPRSPGRCRRPPWRRPPTSRSRSPSTRSRATGSLRRTARAATLGGTCLDCTATNVLGRSPDHPRGHRRSRAVRRRWARPLTAHTSGWAAGTSFTYQWLIDGTPVAGATGATYTPTVDVPGLPGHPAGDRHAGRLQPHLRDQRRHRRRRPRPRQISRHPADHLRHARRSAAALAVDPGTWEPGTVFTYQWRANGVEHHAARPARSYTPAVATQVGPDHRRRRHRHQGRLHHHSARPAPPPRAVAAGDPLVLDADARSSPAPPKVGVPFAPTLRRMGRRRGADVHVAVQRRQHRRATSPVTLHADGHAAQPAADRHGDGHQARCHPCQQAERSPPRSTSYRARRPCSPRPTITGTPRAGAPAPASPAPGTPAPRRPTSGTPTASRSPEPRRRPTPRRPPRSVRRSPSRSPAPAPATRPWSRRAPPSGRCPGPDAAPRRRRSLAPRRSATLTGDPGTWDAGTTLAYQWLADGTPIAGATA